jgi:hypothetical protein
MIFSHMKTFKDDLTNEYNKNLVTDFQVSPYNGPSNSISCLRYYKV